MKADRDPCARSASITQFQVGHVDNRAARSRIPSCKRCKMTLWAEHTNHGLRLNFKLANVTRARSFSLERQNSIIRTSISTTARQSFEFIDGNARKVEILLVLRHAGLRRDGADPPGGGLRAEAARSRRVASAMVRSTANNSRAFCPAPSTSTPMIKSPPTSSGGSATPACVP